MDKIKHLLPGREHLLKYISAIYRLSSAHIGKKLIHREIGMGQIPYLMILYLYRETNQHFLSRFLKIDKATTTKSIRKLLKLGYIHREVNPEDRRAYKLTLTPLGEEVIPEIISEMGLWNETLFDGFSPEEQEQLISLLFKMFQNICIQKDLPFHKMEMKELDHEVD